VKDKVVDEERRKKGVEMRNNFIQPMDIDIQEVSTTYTSTKEPFKNLVLGIWDPFQPSEVPNLRSFIYDNKIGKIVQEQVKKIPTAQGMPISVLTQVPITRDVMENPIAIATVSTSFMISNEYNIRRLFQKNKEKEEIVRDLEERLQQVKVDEISKNSFKSNVK
jgi:hypothetical protein